MSRQTDLEAKADRTTAEDEELRVLQRGNMDRRSELEAKAPRTAEEDAELSALYTQQPAQGQAGGPRPDGTPWQTSPGPRATHDGPTEPVPPVQPQRPRADGTIPVKGDKDWIRYAGPDPY